MNKIDAETIKKILLIRRDNIGDLICTTPAIHMLREKFPKAKIGILVNSYNADAVAGNPDIDEVYVYEKGKHVEDRSRFSVWFANLALFIRIRRERYDVAIGCGYNYSSTLARYTFLTGARKRIGYASSGSRAVYYNAPLNEPSEPVHEVAAVFKLIEPLGITGEPSNLVLVPSADEKEKVLKFLFPHPTPDTSIRGQASHPRYRHSGAGIPPPTQAFGGRHPNIVAMHISSRKENNQWPADRFVALGNELIKKYNITPLILWAPGSSKNPYHPGDDEKAEEIASKMIVRPIMYKTTSLRELVAAVSICKMIVCCDGGAMHIAAALGKPTVTVWGSTDKRRWAPWKVDHIILQKGNRADEIGVDETVDAFGKLWTALR
ncbi:MAG: glycosyltransferase family 9 protein [Deltaproteobacteria bacterium]|nr:glycosyltransferase family 9 protein [Deltaproteobacteria bacterium]